MAAPAFSEFEHHGDTALEEWAAALVERVAVLEAALRGIADGAWPKDLPAGASAANVARAALDGQGGME